MTKLGTDGHNPGTRALVSSETDREEEESFFRAGDEGRYEGGPALAGEEELDFELDTPAVPVIIRTPEMDARRARYVRLVSASLGALTALFAIGLVRRTAVADSFSHRESAGVVLASPPPAHAPESDLVFPAKPVVERAAEKPVSKPAAPVAKSEARAPAPKPAERPAPAPIAVASIPKSVANFAANPAKPAVQVAPPTAAFPIGR